MSPPRIFSFSMSNLLQSPSLTGERWPKPQDKHQRRRTGDEAAKATPQQGGRNGALHRLHRCDAKPGNGVLEPTCLMIYIYVHVCSEYAYLLYICKSNCNWIFCKLKLALQSLKPCRLKKLFDPRVSMPIWRVSDDDDSSATDDEPMDDEGSTGSNESSGSKFISEALGD